MTADDQCIQLADQRKRRTWFRALELPFDTRNRKLCAMRHPELAQCLRHDGRRLEFLEPELGAMADRLADLDKPLAALLDDPASRFLVLLLRRHRLLLERCSPYG